MIGKSLKQYGREDRIWGKGIDPRIPRRLPYANEGPVGDGNSPTSISGYVLNLILNSLKENGGAYVDPRIRELNDDIRYVSPDTLRRLDGKLNPGKPLPFGHELWGLFDTLRDKIYVNSSLGPGDREYATLHELGHKRAKQERNSGRIRHLGEQEEERFADQYARIGKEALRHLGLK